MKDEYKTKAELIAQLNQLRKENARLKRADKEHEALQAELSGSGKRRRTVYALQNWELTLNSVINNIPEIVYWLDENGRIVFINDAIKNYGYSPDDLPGKNIMDIICPEDRSKAVYKINERRTGTRKTRDLEIKLIKKEVTEPKPAKPAIFLISAEGLYRPASDQFVGTQGIARDISDWKRTTEALRESESRFSAVLEYSRDIHYRLNYDSGTYDYISPSVSNVFDLTSAEITAKGFFRLLRLLHPEDRVKSINYWRSLSKTNKGIGTNEFRILDKHGRYRWMSDNCTLVRDEMGQPVFIVGNSRDITDRKQAEEEKRLLEMKLMQAEKMEAVGKLAGSVAHDLNNVLSSIIGYPDLILMNLPTDARIRKPLLTIKKAGQRAVAIVQDMLTLARRGVTVKKVIDLNTLVTDYIKSPEYEKLHADYPSVNVETQLSPDLFNIIGSPVHLTKTLMNLVNNAAEAMPEGGTVSISTFNRYIDKAMQGYDLAMSEGDYAVLRVSDDGVGIAPGDFQKIFEPFYTKKEMGRSGTGLGMAVVWNTVKDHFGNIDVHSIMGVGTTFELYLPITREHPARESDALCLRQYMGGGEKILVVDDIEEQGEIASMLLDRLGYRVDTVNSGEDAVSYLEKNKVHLVLLDMIMEPGMDGLDTCKKIMELPHPPGVIITSGYIKTDRVKEALKLGAGQYIRKPYCLERIGVALKKELQAVKKSQCRLSVSGG
ncbi:MAG: PAS domain S-box protein [bacterium]|nr:PAS domain S-box protein [bacterium]